MKHYLITILIAGLVCTKDIALSQSHLFTNYKVPIYKGYKAKLRLKDNHLAKMYRTTIIDTYCSKKNMDVRRGATGLNFAGHYCFVYWGCGSNCQDGAVVDLKTGIVYPAITASMGFEFRNNSRLVIVNPGQTADSCAFCAQEYWLWNDHAKAFRKLR
jgi:hypothetical protein